MSAPGRHLLFWIDGRPCALALTDLAGAADCGELRRVPGAPSCVLGLTAWRGRLLTVVDVGALLGGPDPRGPSGALLPLAAPLEAWALAVPAPLRLEPGDEATGPDVAWIRPAALLEFLEHRASEAVHG